MTLLPDDRSAAPWARAIPDATVARLPVYLRALTALAGSGTATCSSSALASAVGVNPAQVRKDLSFLGSHGTRGVGYDVQRLRDEVAGTIGLTREWRVVIVGVGHLGTALSAYQGFDSRGIHVAALVDADPRQVGTRIGDLVVEPADQLATVVAERGIDIAVIATPGEAAQQVADALVAAGIRSILNFAPAHLDVPAGVDVRKVDLSIELQILAYHEQRRDPAAEEAVTA